jgi:hypothetical protein
LSAPLPPGTPEERDAWLHQALRHAPDASAAPPKALRDAILAEARSAVRRRPAARRSLTDRFAEFWSWLARPPVAAGFASVMAATLVGLMWWDRPMDEALPPPPSLHRAEPPQAAPAAPTVPNPATSSDTAAAAETAAAPNGNAPARTPAAPAQTVAPRAFVAEPRQDDRRASNSLSASPVATPFPEKSQSGSNTNSQNLPAATAIAKKSEPAPAPTTNARAAAADAQGPVTMQAPRTAPAETRADASTNDAKSADALAAAPRAEALAAKPESALRQAGVAPPRAFAAAPAPARETQGTTDSRRAGADSAAAPMADLLSSIARDAAHWSRLTASGAAVALDAPAQAWLAGVDAAAAGRWRAEIDRTGRADAAPSADSQTLLLRRDGQPAATVRVEDGGVFFVPQTGPAWFAPLPAEAVARLRATLPAPSR